MKTSTMKKIFATLSVVAAIMGCYTVETVHDDAPVSASQSLAAPALGAGETEQSPGTISHRKVTPKTDVVTNAFQNAETELRQTFAVIGDVYHTQSNLVKTAAVEPFTNMLTYAVENAKVNYLSTAAFDEMYDDMDFNYETNVVVFLQPKPTNGAVIRYELLMEEPSVKVPVAIRTANDFNYISNDPTIFSITNYPVLYHFTQVTTNIIYVTRDYLKPCEPGHLLYSAMGIPRPDEM